MPGILAFRISLFKERYVRCSTSRFARGSYYYSCRGGQRDPLGLQEIQGQSMGWLSDCHASNVSVLL